MRIASRQQERDAEEEYLNERDESSVAGAAEAVVEVVLRLCVRVFVANWSSSGPVARHWRRRRCESRKDCCSTTNLPNPNLIFRIDRPTVQRSSRLVRGSTRLAVAEGRIERQTNKYTRTNDNDRLDSVPYLGDHVGREELDLVERHRDGGDARVGEQHFRRRRAHVGVVVHLLPPERRACARVDLTRTHTSGRRQRQSVVTRADFSSSSTVTHSACAAA